MHKEYRKILSIFFSFLQSHTRAVNEAFRICVEKGLIYRGNYLVHWSPALRSVLSDIEVDHLEVVAGKKFLDVPSGKALVGQMFDVAYRVDGMEDQWVTVSTTRPETILGMYLHPYIFLSSLSRKKIWNHFLESRFLQFFSTNLKTNLISQSNLILAII